MNQTFELLYRDAEEYSKKVVHLKNQIWQLEKEICNLVECKEKMKRKIDEI